MEFKMKFHLQNSILFWMVLPLVVHVLGSPCQKSTSSVSSAPQTYCKILSTTIYSVIEDIGQKVEILAVVPEIMMNCIVSPSFAYHLLAVKSCSSKDWSINSHHSQKFSSRPIYTFFACDLVESVNLLQTIFKELILSFRWFILYEPSSLTAEIIRELSSLSFRVDSLLLLINANRRNEIYEAYKIRDNTSIIIRPVIHWNREGEHRRSFHGAPLRVTGVMDNRYDYDTRIELDAHGLPLFLDGIAIQVLFALQQTMNFTLVKKTTNSWGDYSEDTKSWVGMIQELLSDEADLAISSASDLPFRRAVIDFNMPTNVLKLAAFFRKPRNSADAKALTEPFQGTFWLAVVCSIITLSLVLILFKFVLVRVNGCGQNSLTLHHFEDGDSVRTNLQRLDTIGLTPNSKRKPPADDDIDELWDAADCFQWALGTICYQGFYNIPKYDCYRIVIGMGCLSGVIIYGAYAGTLISFLSVAVDSINNMQQLLANKFVVSIVGPPVATKFFRDSPSEIDRAVYRRRRINPIYTGLDEAKSELLKGSIVFFADQVGSYSLLINKLPVKDSCSIKEITVPYASQKQGSMVPKNSPYKRMIDYQILRMTESGLIHQLNMRYIPARIPCSNTVTFDGVQLTSVSVAFGILCFGAILSLSLVVAEKTHKYFGRRETKEISALISEYSAKY